MTTISPTRVSMYDFLYRDIQPMVSLLADTANLSIPQTIQATTSSLQAIVAALLAYHQRHQGQAVSKKLFSRNAVRELRRYNAMNFTTLNATLYHRHDMIEVLFEDNLRVEETCERIASQIAATPSQIKILLGNLSIIALRELAILADYSHLDSEELDHWFALQPQFLTAKRFDAEPISKTNLPFQVVKLADESSHQDENDENNERLPPAFDDYWYQLVKFETTSDGSSADMQQSTADYLKAIGRSAENIQQGRHNDMLVFASMPAITLPHQRWLLQLAKISDIYLSRNRLRITCEPQIAPTRPLVSLSLITGNSDSTPATTSETPIEYDKPKPLWKNPVILITLLVIGILSALAFLKYEVQKNNSELTVTNSRLEQANKDSKQQDAAIVRIDEEDKAERSAH